MEKSREVPRSTSAETLRNRSRVKCPASLPAGTGFAEIESSPKTGFEEEEEEAAWRLKRHQRRGVEAAPTRQVEPASLGIKRHKVHALDACS